MTREALCQDCLRIIPVGALLPSENDPPGTCPHCSGQTCDCDACMSQAAALRKGNLGSVALADGLRLAAWSEEAGATVARADESALASPAMGVIEEIAAERRRQIEAEGYDAAHDDDHHTGDMALAAAAYAEIAGSQPAYQDGHWVPHPADKGPLYAVAAPETWPWGAGAWKPKDKRRDLIRAAALIVAEIERMDRAARRAGP